MPNYTDGEALEIANDCADKIVADYTGMTVGENEFWTDQLESRIVRLCMAFHHHEAHMEGTKDGSRTIKLITRHEVAKTLKTLAICVAIITGMGIQAYCISLQSARIAILESQLRSANK